MNAPKLASLDRVAVSSALAGGAGLLALNVAPGAQLAQLDLVERLLVLGPMVGVPLGLSLCAHGAITRNDARWLRWLARMQPVTALSALASVLVPSGNLAAIVSAPWLAFCALVGLAGALRALARLRATRSLWSEPRFALDAALVYLPVGGLWNTLARAGARPLGFDDAIVRLTAVHFHFAGWVAPIFAARLAIALDDSDSPRSQRLARVALWITVVGPALVGGAITVSQWTGSALGELASALVLAATLVVVGALTIRAAFSQVIAKSARACLVASSAMLALTMTLAVLYACSRVTHSVWPSIPFMARWHGTANTLGYAGLGLLGWTLEDAHRARAQNKREHE